MEIELLAVLPIGILFLLSGIIINAIQAACYVFIGPFSKKMFRRINGRVVELLWYQIVWLFDWWAGIQVELFADSETLQSMGKEHALIMSNHRSDIDWLVGWVFAQRSGCLGSSLAIMKKSSMFLPVVGWAMWFSDYLFINRSWDKDEKKLQSGLQNLQDFPRPFWLALFAEGTRFTQTKLMDAQNYAVLRGLPIPRNVLIPRTKGFVSAVNNLRSFVPAIYNATVIIPKISSSPTMLSMLKRQSSLIHVHIKRHSMDDLPETDESLAMWCRDLFVAKDSLLDEYLANGTFDTKHRIPLDRPINSLLVVICWSFVITLATLRFLKCSCIFSTWKGSFFSSCIVLVVAVIMRIFIIFSQSERSVVGVKKD